MYIIEVEEKKYELDESKMTFEIYAIGIQKLWKEEPDRATSGAVVFDACYKGDDIIDIKKNTQLYITLCLQSANLIQIYDSELKKN